MKKKPQYTSFRDIPQFTRDGNYEVDVPWGYIEEQLEHWGRYPEAPLELDPDFQRGHVWDVTKQARYVEYGLRGGKSARLLYWNCSSWMNNYDTPLQLVDGKQRLEAVRAFFRNEFPVFGNTWFRDFKDALTMTGPSFRFQVNNLKNRAQVLQWYLDLNTGGVVHSDDEIEKVKKLLDAELHGP